jgi:hypothetical protein
MQAVVELTGRLDSPGGLAGTVGENAGDTEPEETKECAAVDTPAVRARRHHLAPVGTGRVDGEFRINPRALPSHTLFPHSDP